MALTLDLYVILRKDTDNHEDDWCDSEGKSGPTYIETIEVWVHVIAESCLYSRVDHAYAKHKRRSYDMDYFYTGLLQILCKVFQHNL